MTHPLSVNLSRNALQCGDGELIVAIQATAPQRHANTVTRMPFNIAIALDVSSSMKGVKLHHAKVAAQRIVSRLEPQDHCAVVTFASDSTVLMPSTAMTESARELLIAELEKTIADGNTALYAGWRDAVTCVEQADHDGLAIQRVFLLTDGEANVGVNNPGLVARAVTAAQQRGISTSTFGLGDDYNERLLGIMASAGEGNTYFIEDADDIDAFFGQELDHLSTTTLRNAELTVNVPADAQCTVVGDRNHTRNANTLTIPMGAMMSGESRQVLLHLVATESLALGTYHIDAALSAIDANAHQFDATVSVPLLVSAQADVIAEELERSAALLDKAAVVAQALAYHKKGDYAGAVALITARIHSHPMYARFGVYEEELSRFKQRIDGASMKRMRMHSNDMVNSSPATLDKYRMMLELLHKKNGRPEDIALIEEQIRTLEAKFAAE